MATPEVMALVFHARPCQPGKSMGNTEDREPAWDMAKLALPDGTEVRNIDWARRHAMTPYGQLPHINYWHRYGLYDVYPELKGQGPDATDFPDFSHERPVPCVTQPVLETLLTQFFRALAKEGVPEIAVWQSEFEAQCGCSVLPIDLPGWQGRASNTNAITSGVAINYIY